MFALLALVLFAALLIYAACSDIASLTIPNWVSLTMAGLFIVLAPLSGMALAEIGLHLALGFAALVAGFFLFQANIIGGGDAKLLAAGALWAGPAAFLPFMVWTMLAGGGLALFILVVRPHADYFAAVGAPAFVNRLLTPKSGAPYGVAIMAGGLASISSIPLTAGALTLL